MTDRPLTTAQARASQGPQDTPQALPGPPGRPVRSTQLPRGNTSSTPNTGAPPEAVSTASPPNLQTPRTSHTPQGRPDHHQNKRGTATPTKHASQKRQGGTEKQAPYDKTHKRSARPRRPRHATDQPRETPWSRVSIPSPIPASATQRSTTQKNTPPAACTGTHTLIRPRPTPTPHPPNHSYPVPAPHPKP
ncbi:uncharacterized protein LOC129185285 [Dunckerocampus dactyliophorus]|uniref:uncharacterized protein LOC129185285 n=1 Tax=Dunckerocampus dactyliophorus TaxID=161453 RepID=UPI00240612B5|nr:uncharacterized protein LOC129185285 [Dunckerocampus dactyliophorus]